MIRRLLPLVLIALGACAPVEEDINSAPAIDPVPEAGASLGRVRDEGDFLSLVAARTLVSPDGELTVASDGTYAGVVEGQTVAGRWTWRTPVWCATPTGADEACFAWERVPGGVRLIRNRGMGGGTDYAIR